MAGLNRRRRRLEQRSDATALSYSFLTAQSENGYEYRAVLSNSGGSATTRAAT